MPTQKPQTVGELRKLLSDAGARWQVDPKYKDSDPIPQFPTGGKWTTDFRPAPLTNEGFRAALSNLTANTYVTGRRLATGILSSDSVPTLLKTRMVPGGSDAGPLPTTLPTPPPLVDWRNRFGWDWVTSVQNQDPCNDCWCFSAAALIEAMVRIEHCVWFKGSEAELRWGCGASCASDGGDDHAIHYAIGNGLRDEQCEPYTSSDTAETPCADCSGRTVRLDQATYVTIPANGSSGNQNYQMQKVWLDLNGPFGFFMDAANLPALGSGVVDDSGISQPPNLDHFVLAVGYDDSLGAWICKNSWGASWDGNGFFYLAYGARGSDLNGHSAIYGTNPDPWSKRRLHSGSLIEGENGQNHMNFDFIWVPGDGSLQHYSRNNDSPALPWSQAETIPGNDAIGVGWPAIAETTYNRNLELVYTTTGQRLHHWWYGQPTGPWNDGGVFGPVNAVGAPGFLQSNFAGTAAPGNFEVVVLNADQQLEHWWRNNGDPSLPWQKTTSFGGGIGFSGPAFIQSHYGAKGNFELVCVLMNGQMQHWFRNNDAADLPWSPTSTFGSNIASAPCMIEGNSGAGSEYAIGNFELCVASGGYLQHWYRQNNGDVQWHGPTIFGDGHETSVIGLIQSSFGFNLELLAARDDGHVQHYWRDSASLEWHAGEFVV